MHSKNVLHNGKSGCSPRNIWSVIRDWLSIDIKPNNILVDYEESSAVGMAIENIQISDLEDTVIVPLGKWLIGALCGDPL